MQSQAAICVDNAVAWYNRDYISIDSYSYKNCLSCCSGYASNERMDEIRSGAMPWIGLYVAGASLICSLAMAADLFLGFRNKKLWFPCKFFTLNAASLTLLAVAMKLPLDLTTNMPGISDWLAKRSSIVFMCTVMGNFMPSLGQMNNKEIIMNLAALGILVVTIFVNMCIQIEAARKSFGNFYIMLLFDMVILFVMFILFVLMSSSALYVPSTKKYIDLMYNEVHKTSSSDGSDVVQKFNVDKLREDVRKYWMMAETGSPQFVMARSVTSVLSGAYCVLTAILFFFIEILIYYPFEIHSPFEDTSSYKWSTFVILMIQTIGVGVGTIACAFRGFTTTKLIWSGLKEKTFKLDFRIEKYWIERLVEWKENALPLKIRSHKWKRIVHNVKNLILCFCIWIQIMIVVVSKFVQLLFVFLSAPFLLCYHYCKQLKSKLIPNSSTSNNYSSLGSTTARKIDLARYVLHLEGENELPERILKSISDSADRLIQMGIMQQQKYLKELLKKSTDFKGVAEFDNDQAPSLVSCEPPNTWMMPVVTLTSIAIALPNITNQMTNVLLSSASEGLIYTCLIEKDLDGKGDFSNIRNAAEVIWLGIELSRTWLDQDFRKLASKEKNSRGTLESLAAIAKTNIVQFMEKENEIQKENPFQWPVKAIAANSMYRICTTLMLNYDIAGEQSDEDFFKKLSVIISDILGACLTNLPRVITMKCFCSVTEKREESVKQAAYLLGETEEIMKILQQRELPSLNQDQAACIDQWRAIIRQEHKLAFISSSNNDTTSSSSSGIHTVVELEAF